MTLNLSAFGRRVLNVLRAHKSRLTLTADVLLFVGSTTMTQSQVDDLCTDGIHWLIRLTTRQLRFDAWQSARRTHAVQLGELIDQVIDPMSDQVGLSDDAQRLVHFARVALGARVCELLESGYSVRSISRELGIPHRTLADRVQSLRTAN